MCPYCNQGQIMEVIVKKTKEIIYICEECDMVWITNESVLESTGIRYELYAKAKGFSNL